MLTSALSAGWRPAPVQQSLGQVTARVRPLRASHQLPDGASGGGEAPDRADPRTHARDDEPLRGRPRQRLDSDGPSRLQQSLLRRKFPRGYALLAPGLEKLGGLYRLRGLPKAHG